MNILKKNPFQVGSLRAALLCAALIALPVAATPTQDLWNAMMSGDLDAAQIALDRGADINAVAQDVTDDDDPEIVGMSMLMLAISYDVNLEGLAFLIEHGADIHYTIPTGKFEGASALFVAEYFGYDEAMQLLEEAGATFREEELRLKAYLLNISMQECTRAMMQEIEEFMEEFQKRYGFYPKAPEGKKIDDLLRDVLEYRILKGETPELRPADQDCWGTPMEYQSDGVSYTLTSYGADLVKGGSGEFDADIVSTHSQEPTQEPLVLADVLPARQEEQATTKQVELSPGLSPEGLPEGSDKTLVAEEPGAAETPSVAVTESRELDPARLPGMWNIYAIRKETLPDQQAIDQLMTSLESGEKTLVGILGEETLRVIPPGTTEFLTSGALRFKLTDYMTYDTLIYIEVTGTWQPVDRNALAVRYTTLDDVKITLTADVSQASKDQRQPELDAYTLRFKAQTERDSEFLKDRTWSCLYVGETYLLLDMEDHRSYFIYQRTPEESIFREEEPRLSTLKTAVTNPQDISAAIVTIYHEVITEVAGVVKDHPEAASVKPVLAEMKAGYIQHLVELGKQRETMSEAGKAKVSLETRLRISRVPAEAYQIYSDAISHYFKLDQEVWTVLRSFNIITQYAFFELLKQQEPEEAKRLGIE